MKEEHLQNYIDFVTDLVLSDYYGEIHTKFHGGIITISTKSDNIKLDNKNYKEYKNKIINSCNQSITTI